jgi:hypothetical protein
MIRAGIFKHYSDETTKYNFSPQEKERLRQKLKDGFTPEEQQLLAKAVPLNTLLLRTDLNDAEKTAKGIAFLARINTDHTGKVDTKQLSADLATFFIDQDLNLIGVGAWALAGVGKSPIAYVLFGGKRIGAEGWKPELYDKAGEPQHNQAHHLAMFIIEGMNKGRDVAETEAKILDDTNIELLGIFKNENDVMLSEIGIDIGRSITKGQINLSQLEVEILKKIEEKH